MEIVCAWCGKKYGEKAGRGINGVSHTICQECSTRFELEMKQKTDDEKRSNKNEDENDTGEIAREADYEG